MHPIWNFLLDVCIMIYDLLRPICESCKHHLASVSQSIDKIW